MTTAFLQPLQPAINIVVTTGRLHHVAAAAEGIFNNVSSIFHYSTWLKFHNKVKRKPDRDNLDKAGYFVSDPTRPDPLVKVWVRSRAVPCCLKFPIFLVCRMTKIEQQHAKSNANQVIPDRLLHSYLRRCVTASSAFCQSSSTTSPNLSTYGRRAFSVAGPAAWNCTHVRRTARTAVNCEQFQTVT